MFKLRMKSANEIKEEESQYRAYRNHEFKACPMQVIYDNGSVENIWDIPEGR